MRLLSVLIVVGLSSVISAGRHERAAAEAAFFVSQQQGRLIWGRVYNAATAEQAHRTALKGCESHGGTNCKLATMFDNQCFALARQSGGNGYSWQSRSDIDSAKRGALQACAKMGKPCRIADSFCDVVKEALLVCTQPVFKEERRLRAEIDGIPAKTNRVAAAITYLHSKYCRSLTGVDLIADSTEDLEVGCAQHSGLFRGERVYWGQCFVGD